METITRGFFVGWGGGELEIQKAFTYKQLEKVIGKLS